MTSHYRRDQARQTLIDECANDLSDSLFNDAKFRFQLCRDGFGGFTGMSDADLIRATTDAGLGESRWNEERNERVRAAIATLEEST